MANSHVTNPAITAAKEVQAQVEPCKKLCELCVKRGYDFCANAAKTTRLPSGPWSKEAEMVAAWTATPQAQRLTDAEIDAEWEEHDKAYAFVSSKWSFEAGVKFAETAFCRKNGISLGD